VPAKSHADNAAQREDRIDAMRDARIGLDRVAPPDPVEIVEQYARPLAIGTDANRRRVEAGETPYAVRRRGYEPGVRRSSRSGEDTLVGPEGRRPQHFRKETFIVSCDYPVLTLHLVEHRIFHICI
jgi:hypothetical protein